jgi:hypothetical protein
VDIAYEVYTHQDIMKSYQILMFTFLMNLCLIVNLQAQSTQNNMAAVKSIYEAVKNYDTSTLTAELVAKMKEQKTEVAIEATDRYQISLLAILENRWEEVTLNNLNILELEENKVSATGEFSGRQTTECEFIPTNFRHVWSIQEGNIINFKEQIKQ